MDSSLPEDCAASLYDDLLAEMFLVRSDADVLNRTLEFLVKHLRLAPGARVLDQGCGIGSLSIGLAARGMRMLGIDQSEPYVLRAEAEAQRLGLDCEFQHADAFDFVAEPPSDAAFSWATSFGNAVEDARNGRMLQRAFAS
jgi:SAM-dependent methyltransferase